MKNFLHESYKKPLASLLFEQEEEAEAAEEEGAEETEEAGDETADDEPETDTESSAEGEKSDNEALSAVSLDDDIEAVLIDFESAARKEASLSVSESKLSVIYEQSDEIDIGSFAADVARLVKNYDNLLDIEQLLVKKSSEFISQRYGDDMASSFEDEMETQHDIEISDEDKNSLSTDLQTPLAVGATSAAE